MTAALAFYPKFRAYNSTTGVPLASGKVHCFATGTGTRKDTYTDQTKGTKNANPVILDSAGMANIWLDGEYRIRVDDSDDNIIAGPIDNISNQLTSGDFASDAQTIAGTATTVAVTPANLQALTGTAARKGISEHATDGETVTGTSTTLVTTPANITAKMAAPGTIGGTTPGAGNFSSIPKPGAIGGTTPAAAAFTTISATGVITVTSGQVAFPATAVPSANANTLDDYQEGNHTCVCTPATSGTITLAVDDLAWTKIGREVRIQGRIGVASYSSPVGDLHFSLPHTVSVLTTGSDYSTGAIRHESAGFTLDASALWLSVDTVGSVTYFFISENFDNANYDTIDGADVSGNFYFSFSLSYMVT